MIHQICLPEITRNRLTDVVALQVLVLTYAATRDTLIEASSATYLDRCAKFSGRGAQIAAWIWRAPGRCEPLKRFAEGPTAPKLEWTRRITREAFAFLHHPIGHIDTHVRRTASLWERAGGISFEGSISTFVATPDYLAVFSPSQAQALLEDRICWRHLGKQTAICSSVRYAMRPATTPDSVGIHSVRLITTFPKACIPILPVILSISSRCAIFVMR